MKWRNYREWSKASWGRSTHDNEEINNSEVQLGAVLRVADAMDRLADLIELIHNDTRPKKRIDSLMKQRVNENASRKRSEEAYLKAGGKLSSPDRDALEGMLSSSILNALEEADMLYINNLRTATNDDLLEIRGIGKSAVRKIRKALAELDGNQPGGAPSPA